MIALFKLIDACFSKHSVERFGKNNDTRGRKDFEAQRAAKSNLTDNLCHETSEFVNDAKQSNALGHVLDSSKVGDPHLH